MACKAPHPWSKEAQVEKAKTSIEAAYRLLCPFLPVHFSGEPSREDLRDMLRSAYQARTDLRAAIACAEMHFQDNK